MGQLGIFPISVALLSQLLAPHAMATALDDSRIMGGEPAKACSWPTTVSISHCTATLIHPQVIIYAAHCGGKVPQALFGESTGKPAKRVDTKYCKTNPKFSMKEGPGKGTDFAFCVLKEPVKDVPIAPILFGCEIDALVKDAAIWLVGFGKNDNKSGGPRSGVKHKVETDFVKFRNSQKKELVVGSNGKTACNGDSGGPAFIQLEDGSWRTFGITSHGEDTSCTKVAYYTHAAIMVPWMQKFIHDKGDTHIDVTPCFDDDGTWNPSEECGGFAKDYDKAYGSWDNFCSKGAPTSGASSTCGKANPKAKGGSGNDGDGGGSDGEEKEKDKAPNVSFRSPSSGDQFDEGEEISVEVEAEDDLDDELQVQLFVDGKPKKKDSKSPYRWTLSDLSPGEHKLVAKAQDSSGNQSKTEALTVEVAGEEEPSQSQAPGSQKDPDSSNQEPSATPEPEDSKKAEPNAEPSKTNPASKPRSGCVVGDGPAPWTAALALPLMGLIRRRRTRKS